MKKAAAPSLGRIDGIPAQEILEGLERLHQLVVVTDARGRIVWISEAMTPLWGDRGEAIPPPVGTILRRLCLREHPESSQIIDLDISSASAPASAPSTTGSEHRLPRLPRRVELSAFEVDSIGEGGAGIESLTVAIARPVDEEEKRDTSAARAEGPELFESIVENSTQGIVIIDAAGFVTYANAAIETISGMHPKELVGKPITLFLPTTPGVGRVVAQLRRHGEISDQRLQIHDEDGGSQWLSLSVQPLTRAGTKHAGSVISLSDVTRQQMQLRAVEEQNAGLESYVHSVSHDLRSPLVSLLGFTRLLRQDYEDRLDSTGHHFVDRIEQAGKTMEMLIHDILELSRIGARGEHRALVDPRTVLMQLHAEIKPQLEERGVALVLPSDPPMLLCDRTRLYQVFSNLIGNALHHMGDCEGPQIRVEIVEQPGRHLISVGDNGQGISRDDHERIFEAFQTLATRTGRGESTGIGLAIVKKIALTHGGQVWVESEQGQGATFHLALPRS